MILLLGGTGYIGQAFAAELRRREIAHRIVSRREVDYTHFDALLAMLRAVKPEFLINAAGYTGKPNVDACELDKAGTIAGNVLLPQTIAHACAVAEIPWGQVSSGCIFSGAKISTAEGLRTVKDLTPAEVMDQVERHPETIQGFTETDRANFCFADPPCSFYSGTKALGEAAIAGAERHYNWRLRIPFDEWDNPRNYLTKIQTYPRVYNNVNSISHRGDFARACLDLWELRAPFGTYNVTNPGFITTRQVVRLLQTTLQLDRAFEFWANDEEFYRVAAKTPRSNCVLDVSKLLAAGVKIRPVLAAIEDSLAQWRPAARVN